MTRRAMGKNATKKNFESFEQMGDSHVATAAKSLGTPADPEALPDAASRRFSFHCQGPVSSL